MVTRHGESAGATFDIDAGTLGSDYDQSGFSETFVVRPVVADSQKPWKLAGRPRQRVEAKGRTSSCTCGGGLPTP